MNEKDKEILELFDKLKNEELNLTEEIELIKYCFLSLDNRLLSFFVDNDSFTLLLIDHIGLIQKNVDVKSVKLLLEKLSVKRKNILFNLLTLEKQQEITELLIKDKMLSTEANSIYFNK